MKATRENEPVAAKLGKDFGYFATSMNPPPAEKKSTVVQFALTEGCSHASCTFCTMYREDGEAFSVKTLPEFRNHVDAVLGHLKENPRELSNISRIFLGAGNALSVDTELLLEASQYALCALMDTNHDVPRRLAVYGNTLDILEKGYQGIRELYCGGTCASFCSISRLGTRRGVDVIYWGVESGNSNVLKIAGKGYDGEQAGRAGSFLSRARVKPSVMIMPGLGGIAYAEDHVRDTVNLLNDVQPTWITFIGLKIDPGSPYATWIEKEEKANRNRRMTPLEIVEQTAQMVEGLNFQTIIGIHGDDIHAFGHNPVPIGVAKINYGFMAREVAAQIRRNARVEFG